MKKAETETLIEKNTDPFKSNKLSERQWAVLKAKGKHSSTKRALLLLDNEYGIKMSRATYFRELSAILKLVPELEDEFAERGLSNRHFIRKNTFEEITEEMWVQYYNEGEPLKRVAILAQIANMEQLNSIADSDSALIIERQIRMKKIVLEKQKMEKEMNKSKRKDAKRKDS